MDNGKLPDKLRAVYPLFLRTSDICKCRRWLEDLYSVLPDISFIFTLSIRKSRSHILPVTTIPKIQNKAAMSSNQAARSSTISDADTETVSGDGKMVDCSSYKNFGKDFLVGNEFVCAVKCKQRFNIQTGTVGEFLLFSDK
jgi:hypothetical protein